MNGRRKFKKAYITNRRFKRKCKITLQTQLIAERNIFVNQVKYALIRDVVNTLKCSNLKLVSSIELKSQNLM